MYRKLSPEQLQILNHQGNTVVIANPGSGKTFIVCEKIKNIVEMLLEYEGVIAISYTNKASKELKDRLKNTNTKASCFSTLDVFLLREIVYPFGNHVFGNVNVEFEICDNHSEHHINFKSIGILSEEEKYVELEKLYRKGVILLENISDLAIYIISRSEACRRYLKCKYKYIFIDEYQDCGEEQHTIFLKIVSLGIIGVAVGDPNQSIYGFSGKSSKYLIKLANEKEFKTFKLTKNYRSNKAIVDYSLRLLDGCYEIKNREERVYYKRIEGTQENICRYIDRYIEDIMNMFNVEDYNEIGVLVRSDASGGLINKYLRVKHRYFKTTELDKNSSLWGGVFKNLIRHRINSENSYELSEEFFDKDDKAFLKLYMLLEEIKDSKLNIEECKSVFIGIAKLIYPYAENEEAIKLLDEVLENPILYNSYKEADKNEIQIMTLHKSKGLEFKVVFHLDLYKYILPAEGANNGVWGYKDLEQCLNLHYVGVTRAIEACFLLTSTQRYNTQGEVKQGIDSEFLSKNNVEMLVASLNID